MTFGGFPGCFGVGFRCVFRVFWGAFRVFRLRYWDFGCLCVSVGWVGFPGFLVWVWFVWWILRRFSFGLLRFVWGFSFGLVCGLGLLISFTFVGVRFSVVSIDCAWSVLFVSLFCAFE